MRELLHSLVLDVGPEFRCEVSRVRPTIENATGLVVSWSYRLAVRLGEASGYDDFTVELPAAMWRPLASWTLTDLRELFHQGLRTSQRVQSLIKIVQVRRDFTVIEDFDLRQLEGAEHEQLPSR